MRRRKFIRSLVQAGVAGGAFALDNPLRPRFRLARAAEGKSVIWVYQRGGCDGLNTVVPYGDTADYYRLRETIGVAPPVGSGVSAPGDLIDATPSLALEDLNTSGYSNYFALHRSLEGMHTIYGNGDMAVLPTVQYPDASRSHFDSQHFMESAASDADRDNKDELDGWLNRHLATLDQPGQLRAVSFGSSVAQSLRGDVGVSSLNDLERFNLGLSDAEEDALVARLLGIYGEVPDPQTTVRELVHQVGGTVFNNLDVINNLDTEYTPDNGAVYPRSGYGRQLQRAAQLIKAGVGLELATISIGGWDTHSNQGGGNPLGSQGRRFRDFSDGITALYTDLGGFTADGGLMNDVVVCTMTEFGRTAKQNGSLGTDHGNGASWFVVHRGLSGGIYLDGVNGTGWPGLRDEDLYRGRYLRWTVDYRDVMAEILTRFMGNADVGTVLREHVPTPVGFFPA